MGSEFLCFTKERYLLRIVEPFSKYFHFQLKLVTEIGTFLLTSLSINSIITAINLISLNSVLGFHVKYGSYLRNLFKNIMDSSKTIWYSCHSFREQLTFSLGASIYATEPKQRFITTADLDVYQRSCFPRVGLFHIEQQAYRLSDDTSAQVTGIWWDTNSSLPKRIKGRGGHKNGPPPQC